MHISSTPVGVETVRSGAPATPSSSPTGAPALPRAAISSPMLPPVAVGGRFAGGAALAPESLAAAVPAERRAWPLAELWGAVDSPRLRDLQVATADVDKNGALAALAEAALHPGVPNLFPASILTRPIGPDLADALDAYLDPDFLWQSPKEKRVVLDRLRPLVSDDAFASLCFYHLPQHLAGGPHPITMSLEAEAPKRTGGKGPDGRPYELYCPHSVLAHAHPARTRLDEGFHALWRHAGCPAEWWAPEDGEEAPQSYFSLTPLGRAHYLGYQRRGGPPPALQWDETSPLIDSLRRFRPTWDPGRLGNYVMEVVTDGYVTSLDQLLTQQLFLDDFLKSYGRHAHFAVTGTVSDDALRPAVVALDLLAQLERAQPTGRLLSMWHQRVAVEKGRGKFHATALRSMEGRLSLEARLMTGSKPVYLTKLLQLISSPGFSAERLGLDLSKWDAGVPASGPKMDRAAAPPPAAVADAPSVKLGRRVRQAVRAADLDLSPYADLPDYVRALASMAQTDAAVFYLPFFDYGGLFGDPATFGPVQEEARRCFCQRLKADLAALRAPSGGVLPRPLDWARHTKFHRLYFDAVHAALDESGLRDAIHTAWAARRQAVVAEGPVPELVRPAR